MRRSTGVKPLVGFQVYAQAFALAIWVIVVATLRILMIEDDPWLGVVLQAIILEATLAEVSVFQSVAAAARALERSEFDFVFLDVNVTDGQTFGIAADLMSHEIPFAFMSGVAQREEVPKNLRQAPFRAAQIKSILSGLSSH